MATTRPAPVRSRRDGILEHDPKSDVAIVATELGRGEIVLDAKLHDIILRTIPGQDSAEIAIIHGLTRRRVQQLLRSPEARTIYVRERDRIVQDISGAIKDEKVPSMIRRSALATRAITTVGEILDEVRDQIAAGNPKASMLRVGVDPASNALHHAKRVEDGSSGGGSKIQISADKLAIIQHVVKESGVDLSDIIKYEPKQIEE